MEGERRWLGAGWDEKGRRWKKHSNGKKQSFHRFWPVTAFPAHQAFPHAACCPHLKGVVPKTNKTRTRVGCHVLNTCRARHCTGGALALCPHSCAVQKVPLFPFCRQGEGGMRSEVSRTSLGSHRAAVAGARSTLLLTPGPQVLSSLALCTPGGRTGWAPSVTPLRDQGPVNMC